MFETFTEFHSSGTVRDLHPIPFSFPPRHGERKTKSGANITVNPEKQRSTTNYFRETALQTPETTIFVSWIFHFDIPQKTIALHCPWLTISPGSVMPSGFWSVAAPAAITAAAGDVRSDDLKHPSVLAITSVGTMERKIVAVPNMLLFLMITDFPLTVNVFLSRKSTHSELKPSVTTHVSNRQVRKDFGYIASTLLRI